jgi:hypothetical protein
MTESVAPEMKRPEGDLVAFRPCGCLGLACAEGHVDESTALELAKCMMLGWRPGYLTTAQVRAAKWSCEQCKESKLMDRPLPVLADGSTGPDFKRFHTKGKVSITFTFVIDGIVLGESEDAALEALAENPFPLFFHVDDFETEWDDDDLETTEVEDGATPSQGADLPPGVDQLVMEL